MIKSKVTQKKVPGKGWEFLIYNTLDQVVATQDSVQRMKAPQEWIITKYDAMGRVIITGTYQHTGSTAGTDMHTVIQGLADGQSAQWEGPSTVTSHGYTSNCWPASWAQSLVINYYDSYTGVPNLPSMYNQLSNTLYSIHTTGLSTASRTLVLNTTGDYLWSVPYYDKEGKAIRTFSEHYLGGSTWLSPYNYDDVQTVYNFVKQPLTVTRLHYNKNSGGTAAVPILTTADSYTYDHMGRRLKSSDQLTDGTNTAQQQVVVSQSTYNEIGQLKQKGLHSLNGISFLQNVNYRYNARGWLTNINNGSLTNDPLTSTDLNDQFGMDLKYDDAAAPQYNGNIGSVKTLTGALSGATLPALTYNYTYDKLNRLTDAISTTSAANDGFYSENLTYDPMGNIQTLKRYDKNGAVAQLIDNLNYIYVSGNKVDRIDDSGTTAGFNNTVSQAGEYTYDGNGSQLTDLNRGLTQANNMLNLPQTVTKSGTSIAYIYDATGRKLRKLSTSSGITTVTEYIDGIQYQYSTATPVLDFISTEEGRARKSRSVYKYEYDLKDHLGDTRITTTWNASDATQMTPLNSQRSDYYAFGYAIQSLQGTTPSPKNQYLYNHKELQEETGLYDYGARFYDPAIARWNIPDPLEEFHYEVTSYNYAMNNPVTNVDIMGLDTANINNVTDHTTAVDYGNGNIIQMSKGATIVGQKGNSQSNGTSQQANNIDVVINRLKKIPRQRYQYGGTGNGNYSDYPDIKGISTGIDCSCYISTGFGDKGRVWTTSAPPPAKWGLKKVDIGHTKTEILKNLKKGDLVVWYNKTTKHTGMIDVENGGKVLLNSHGKPSNPNSGPGATGDLDGYWFDEENKDIPIPTVYRKQ